ncbi:hypothetical protein K492DRAFT_196773 [Lichtheimia hyalospora FSU 10163]|nr:hypothetical protein K492DRAFT_196773 [Lichtheimia hyalospora FSU 10163]
MVASSSSSSSNINIPSLVPQVRSTVNATQPSVARQPETPSPNTSVNETSIMGYEEIMQRLLQIIEKQQQRHNEQMDRMLEMYQQSVTQQAATHRIIDTQLQLSLITQFREIGLTKSEILEQLRSRQ